MSPDNDFKTSAQQQELSPRALIDDLIRWDFDFILMAIEEDPVAFEQSALKVATGHLARGADVNEKNAGLTPLVWAALFNFTHIADLFIKAGAHLDERSLDGKGATALSYAVCHGHVEMVRLLIDAGAQDLDLATGTNEELLPKGSPENKAAINEIIAEEVSARQRVLEEKARVAAVEKESARRADVEQKLALLQVRAPKKLTIRPAGGQNVAR